MLNPASLSDQAVLRSLIRGRSERRLGKMMKEQKKTVGLNRGGRPKSGLSENPLSFKPTLAEAGIDKNLAHRARSLAAMSEKEFKEQVAAISAAMWRPKETAAAPAEPIDPWPRRSMRRQRTQDH